MAAIANLRIDQGASFSSDVTVTGNDDSIFDLTGHTASAKMAKGYASTHTRTNFTTSITIGTGVVTISLNADQTNGLEEGRYVYDVEIVKTSDSTVTRVVEGLVTVYPSATI
jgi:hypothetical protein